MRNCKEYDELASLKLRLKTAEEWMADAGATLKRVVSCTNGCPCCKEAAHLALGRAAGEPDLDRRRLDLVLEAAKSRTLVFSNGNVVGYEKGEGWWACLQGRTISTQEDGRKAIDLAAVYGGERGEA